MVMGKAGFIACSDNIYDADVLAGSLEYLPQGEGAFVASPVGAQRQQND